MRKIIWYLHPYAGAPSIGMSYRPYYLAHELQSLDFSTYVISASFHHLLTRNTRQSEAVAIEQIEGVPYLWLKTPKYSNNGVGRIWNMMVYALRLRLQAKKLVMLTQKPDVIIVSSSHPLHYLTARILAKKYGARLIFEVRDIWPLSLTEILKVSKRHPFVKLLAWIEKLAYQEADFVVSVLSNAFSHMCNKGLDAARFVYIPNGIAITETVQCNQYVCPEIQILKQQHKFVVVYTGAHGKPNALEQLIEALKILQAHGHHHIHAVLVGKGELKEALQYQANNLNNITFMEPLPKTAMPDFLAQADAAFIGWKALSIYQFGISPNKIFDYMLAGKPIVHAINMADDPVQLAQCGLTVSAENPEALAKGLLDISLLPPNVLTMMGLNGQAYVKANHDYKKLAKCYAELF